MKITIAAIGRMKAGPEKELADDYAQRIPALGKKAGITALKVMDWAESQKAEIASRMAEEEEKLWAVAAKGAHVIALDERGKSHTSAQFAAGLKKRLEQGTGELVFLVGGPDGHSSQTRDKSNELLALGAMTWPHRLARVMLLEQIYRSVTILVNHPYHRA